MKKYVGLADDPNTRSNVVGNPPDFKIFPTRFSSREEALKWRRNLELIGYEVDQDHLGWGSGYTYTK